MDWELFILTDQQKGTRHFLHVFMYVRVLQELFPLCLSLLCSDRCKKFNMSEMFEDIIFKFGRVPVLLIFLILYQF